MRTYASESSAGWGDLIKWGIVAGLIGGIVMAMFMMLLTLRWG